MSCLGPCVDYKAMALPLSPGLQHCLHCSFKEILIILKMVFLVLITLKNVAKQDYHLLKKIQSASLCCSAFATNLLRLSQQVDRLSQ